MEDHDTNDSPRATGGDRRFEREDVAGNDGDGGVDEAFVVEEDMRLVKVLVLTTETYEQVVDVLETFDLDYVVSDRTDGVDDSAVVQFPLPAETVEHVQGRFESLGIEDDVYTVVMDPEVVVSDRFEDRETLYHEVTGLGYQGISRSELRGQAGSLMPDLSIYTLLTAISAVVATAGVLLNSIGILVGSMVIAPLIGPIMAASVGTIVDDDPLFFTSVKYQLTGSGVGFGSAVAFASLVRVSSLVSPDFQISQLVRISSHSAPNLLLVVVAFGAGFAGALSLSTGGTIDLVGVMIAAAVMPPIGVAGVAVAWVQPVIVLGAITVVLVNLVSMTLAAILSLWYLGYHPESLTELRKARRTMLVRVVVLVAVLAILAATLAHVSGTELSLPFL